MTLADTQIAILTAGDGVERVELTEPRRVLEAAEAHVVHITPKGGRVRTFDQTDPSEELTADRALAECDPADFDALVLPGGYIIRTSCAESPTPWRSPARSSRRASRSA